MIPLQSAVAAMDLTCPRLVHSDSWTRYSAVTQALDEPVYPYEVMTSVYDRNGWPEHRPTEAGSRLQKVSELIGLIEADVAEQALAFTVEALYKIYDPQQIPNSFYRTETDRIASRVAYLMCQSGCLGSSRQQLMERAQVYVDQWVEKGTPRMSIESIEEHLKINYQGLNSILSHRTSDLGLPHFDSYRHHYLTLLSEFPGPLMRTNVLENRAGPLFTRDDIDVRNGEVRTPEYKINFSTFRVRQALDEFFDNIRHRWQNFNHASLLKFSVFEQMSVYNLINRLEDTDKIDFDGPPLIEERLLLLGKYMISAPVAVARVLNENENLQNDFCWIVEEMDRVISTNHINSSVLGLNNYVMPLTIGVVLFMAPFSATLWAAGLIILNVVTLIDLMGRRAVNQRLHEEIDFYRRHELPNTFNQASLDHTSARTAEYEQNQKMIRNILIMEVVFGGVAIGVSRVSRRIIQRMSQQQQVQVLQRPFVSTIDDYAGAGTRGRRNRRARRAQQARYATRNQVDDVIRRNQDLYSQALARYSQQHGALARDQLMAFNITFFLKHGTKDEILKLLIKSRHTGFGSIALNIEAANEFIEQVYVHLNTAPMSDYTAVTVILEGFTRMADGRGL